MPTLPNTCWHKFEGKGHFMMIGYGRTSTIEQVAGLEAQIRDLKAAGAEKLFSENVSSVAPRKQLEAAIEFAREGDTLVVTKIDRLVRSVRHLTIGRIMHSRPARFLVRPLNPTYLRRNDEPVIPEAATRRRYKSGRLKTGHK
jgi:hypothetical protein